MMQFLSGKASDRKMRLFLVAAARLVWDKVPEGEMRDAVNAAESHADGLVAVEVINEYRGRFYGYVMTGSTPEQREWLQPGDKSTAFTLVRMTTYSAQLLQTLPGNQNWTQGVASMHRRFPPLLRDIFGPVVFRPVAVDPRLLTSTVRDLARAIYEDRAFDRLPILADAFEDAGCDNADILSHCRGDGPHVRGCWVVDLILGKT
jgi:hypothetical protein